MDLYLQQIPMTQDKKKAPDNSVRDQIAEVAARMIADFGYDGATTRDIAKEVGVTVPTIYYYFGDKRGLYRHVVFDRFSVFNEKALSAMRVGNSPIERLRFFVKQLVAVVSGEEVYVKLLLRQFLGDSENLTQELVERDLQPVFDSLRALLNEIRPGLGETILPLSILSMVMGYVNLRQVREYITGYQVIQNAGAGVEELSDLVVQMVTVTEAASPKAPLAADEASAKA